MDKQFRQNIDSVNIVCNQLFTLHKLIFEHTEHSDIKKTFLDSILEMHKTLSDVSFDLTGIALDKRPL